MPWTYLSSIGSAVRSSCRRSLLVTAAMMLSSWSATTPAQAAAVSCNGDAAGITLPDGFCATIFADNIGHARQMAVAPDGTLYVNTWSGIYYNNGTVPPGGFVVALKDTDGDGRADVIERFGETRGERRPRRHRHRILQRHGLCRDQRPHRALSARARTRSLPRVRGNHRLGPADDGRSSDASVPDHAERRSSR